MSESPTAGVHLELFVRSLCPEGCRSSQAAAVRRLEELEAEGTIDDYTVQVCGRAVPPRPSDAVSEFGTYLLNRIAVFREWAAGEGRSLGAHFQPETVRSTVTGTEYERIVFPIMSLAEYEDGALRFVSPCEGSERTWSVPGRLEYLAAEGETGARTERLAGASEEPPDTRLLPTQ
jgi:DNA-binding Lrp family transcriptional regulator